MAKEKTSRKISVPRGGYRRTIESGRNIEFQQVQTNVQGKNPFDMSHNFAFTGNIGELIPTLAKPVYPGENWTIGADMLVRLQALVAPAMHRLDVRTDFFVVPLRILWDNFEKFARNDSDGGLPSWPYLDINDTTATDEKRFLDYIGVATTDIGGSPTERISAMYASAYQKIYNDWYRAQQVITEQPYLLQDGDNTPDIADLLKIQKVTFEHDYFTSALPDPQLGTSPVDIPLGNITLDPTWTAGTNVPRFETDVPSIPVGSVSQPAGNINVGITTGTAYNPDGTLIVNPTTIRDLRRAEIVQQWLEKMNVGGQRYTEVVLMHFGERTSDARLQRAEFITGVTSPVYISEVLNTSGTFDPATSNPTSPVQGNMAGHGVAAADGTFGSFHAEEHSILMGLTYIIPKPAYYQGIPKDFDVPSDPTEMMWPSFAHIGEQEVKQRELYAYTAGSQNVFGYVPRFSELKYAQNRIGGLFKSSMKYWTFARDISTDPTLSQAFLEVDYQDFTEPFAISEQDLILFNIYFKIRAIRALPTFSTPHL